MPASINVVNEKFLPDFLSLMFDKINYDEKMWNEVTKKYFVKVVTAKNEGRKFLK